MRHDKSCPLEKQLEDDLVYTADGQDANLADLERRADRIALGTHKEKCNPTDTQVLALEINQVTETCNAQRRFVRRATERWQLHDELLALPGQERTPTRLPRGFDLAKYRLQLEAKVVRPRPSRGRSTGRAEASTGRPTYEGFVPEDDPWVPTEDPRRSDIRTGRRGHPRGEDAVAEAQHRTRRVEDALVTCACGKARLAALRLVEARARVSVRCHEPVTPLVRAP